MIQEVTIHKLQSTKDNAETTKLLIWSGLLI